jgi:hypothetical protein
VEKYKSQYTKKTFLNGVLVVDEPAVSQLILQGNSLVPIAKKIYNIRTQSRIQQLWNSSIPGYLVFVPAGDGEKRGDEEPIYIWLSCLCSSWRGGRGGRVGTALHQAILSLFIPAGEGEEGGE